MHPSAHCSQDTEATQMFVNRRMDKDVLCVCVCVYIYIYIYIYEYYSVIKRNEIVQFAETRLGLETVSKNKIRKRNTNVVY